MKTLRTVRSQFALLALIEIVAACGRGTNSSYRGEPLATVRGQLIVPEGGSIEGPVRLAIAWYIIQPIANNLSAKEAGLSTPQTVFTQDIEYRGAFPVDYSFDLYAPPPPEALQEIWNGSKWAFGVIIGYQDLNRNGKLDIISPSGSPIDRVLGTSLGDYYLYENYEKGIGLLSNNGFQLVYSDGPAFGTLESGYNLVQNSPYQVVPLSTRVPINLTGAWTNDLYICDVQAYQPGPPWKCGVSPPAYLLEVQGVITALTDGSSVNLSVRSALHKTVVSDADVTVNGRVIPYQPRTDILGAPADGVYELDQVIPFLRVGAPNDVQVRAAGFRDFAESISVPGAIQVTKPQPNSTLHINTPFVIAWTRSDASFYAYWIAQAIPFGAIGGTLPGRQDSVTTIWDLSGPATIGVQAYKFFRSNVDGSYVTGMYEERVHHVEFQP